MTRTEFVKQLKGSLGGLSEGEKKEIVDDYEEHFRSGLASGKNEEEIAQGLGNPRHLAKSYRIDQMLEEGKGRGAASVLRAVFASLSLGFFNVVVVLGPFIGIVAIVVSLWAVAASVAVAGAAVVLAVIAAPIFPSYLNLGGFHPAFLVFAGIGIGALGVLAAVGMWRLTTWVTKLVGTYVRLNVRIVTNRR